MISEFPELDREKLDAVWKRITVHAPSKLKFYVTAGLYPDGNLGEIFIRADRVGSFMSGALDMTAMVMSIGLQHGVPFEAFTSKMRHSRFPPNGFGLGDPEFKSCSSPFDLLAQWINARFGAKPVEESAAQTQAQPETTPLENL